MISPERLRFYRFFSGLNSSQLNQIAMIAQEEICPAHKTLYEMGQPAKKLYLLEEGCVDLYYLDEDIISADIPNGIPVAEVCAGEVFSICALVEPREHSATARVSEDSRIILIDAVAMQALFAKDPQMAYILTKQAAQALRARLDTTRVLIAAAWVDMALEA